MNERDWVLGNDSVAELYEYKNLGVVNNYIGSFSSNADKTRKKSSIIFSSSFDRRNINPLIYIKFWRQACLPTLLYGTELFTLTPSLLTNLEHCQQWFLKNILYVPKFAPRLLLLRLSGLNSVESETSVRKLLFLGRILTSESMAPVVRNLFQIRSQRFFDPDIVSLGVLPSICEALHKYELFNYFESWSSNSICPSYAQWKVVVKSKINVFEENAWSDFVFEHPSFDFAKSCLQLVPPKKFWSISTVCLLEFGRVSSQ